MDSRGERDAAERHHVASHSQKHGECKKVTVS